MMGFVNSRLGTIGGILLTTVLWAVLHVQYDIFGVASVALTGILLGYARIRTGSTLTAVAMHIFGNLIAFAETAVVAAYSD
jgi:membrane protease YdiL (CAAX protease family)